MTKSAKLWVLNLILGAECFATAMGNAQQLPPPSLTTQPASPPAGHVFTAIFTIDTSPESVGFWTFLTSNLAIA